MKRLLFILAACYTLITSSNVSCDVQQINVITELDVKNYTKNICRVASVSGWCCLLGVFVNLVNCVNLESYFTCKDSLYKESMEKAIYSAWFAGASLLSTMLCGRYAHKSEKVYATIQELTHFINHELMEPLSDIVGGRQDLNHTWLVECISYDIMRVPHLRHIRAEVHATLNKKAVERFDEMLYILQQYVVRLHDNSHVNLAAHKVNLYKAVTDFLAVLSKEFCWAKSNPGMCQLTDANRAFLIKLDTDTVFQ